MLSLCKTRARRSRKRCVLREFVEVLYRTAYNVLLRNFDDGGWHQHAHQNRKDGDMEIFQRDRNVVPLEVALANQMRGRAGRRGMDKVGTVIHYTTQHLPLCDANYLSALRRALRLK